MQQTAPVKNRLTTLLAAISINTTLVVVSLMWLSGQYSMLSGWMGSSTEFSIRIDREGWICQWTSSPDIGTMHGTSVGVAARRYEPREAESMTWKRTRLYTEMTRPIPGVFLYRPTSKSPASSLQGLVAIRHWWLLAAAIAAWSVRYYLVHTAQKHRRQQISQQPRIDTD